MRLLAAVESPTAAKPTAATRKSVSRMPAPASPRCACGGRCPQCRAGAPLNAAPLEQAADRQAAALAPAPLWSELPSPVAIAQAPGGVALAPAPASRLSAAYGADLSQVRLHVAPYAAAQLQARAFTTGDDVYFGAGQYAPATPAGRARVAHELAHVAQQRQGAAPVGSVQCQSETGDLILRLGEDGRVEVLYGSPDLPVAGPLGVGFRCHDGRCQFVGARDPVGGGDTYTIDEARDLLTGLGGNDGGDTLLDWRPGLRTPPIVLPTCPLGEIFIAGGCRPIGPVSAPTPTPDLTLALPQTIYTGVQSYGIDGFGFDASTVPASAATVLDGLALRLSIDQVPVIWIDGHADERGDPTYNEALALRRAQAIKDELVARGIAAERLIVRSLGESVPLVSGASTPAEHARNRRVDISWLRQYRPQRPSLFRREPP